MFTCIYPQVHLHISEKKDSREKNSRCQYKEDVCLHVPADATARRLEKYVERGVVTLRAWDFDWSPMFMRYQSHALNDCLLRSLAHLHPTWMMMMDVDEFLVPAAALASTGLPRAVLLSPSSAEEEASVNRALSQLLPRTVQMLLEGVSGAADGGASGAMPAAWAAAGQNAPSGRCDQTSHSLRRVPNYHC